MWKWRLKNLHFVIRGSISILLRPYRKSPSDFTSYKVGVNKTRAWQVRRYLPQSADELSSLHNSGSPAESLDEAYIIKHQISLHSLNNSRGTDSTTASAGNSFEVSNALQSDFKTTWFEDLCWPVRSSATYYKKY